VPDQLSPQADSFTAIICRSVKPHGALLDVARTPANGSPSTLLHAGGNAHTFSEVNVKHLASYLVALS